MKIRSYSWLLALIVAGSLAGCGGGGTSDAEIINSDLQIPDVYKQNCMTCHGNQLQGQVGPDLLQVGERLTTDEIAQIISQGKGGMPNFGKRISEEEIASISVWLSELK